MHQLSTFFLLGANPRLFLILSIKTLLIGIGLLAFALYLTFKEPEDLKRHAWLRHFKGSDWAHYLAGGILFTSASVAGIIKSGGELGWELSETETGIARGLFIVAALAMLALFIIKAAEKFNE